MLNAKVIGVGQAGNKAAINLIERGVINQDNVLLINSTLKDIPSQYHYLAHKMEGSEGCAKERGIAKRICMTNLKSGELNLDQVCTDDDAMVIICTSAEGGTGSGSATVLAKYFSEVLRKIVHVFIFGGFESDVRGLKNTVDIFKEMDKNFIVEAVCNSKFLDDCNGNKLKAEQAANNEFAERIKILLGQNIVDSETNIDDTDLLKIVTTPGFMMIEHGDLGKPKNVQEFNETCTAILDNSKSYSIEPNCIRLAVIINIDKKLTDSIDYQFMAIREKLGKEPFEIFTHIQHLEGTGNTIAIMASGMKMPLEEIKEIYDTYKTRTANVDGTEDDFYNMEFDTDSDAFDMLINRGKTGNIDKRKASFFNDVDVEPESNPSVMKKEIHQNTGKFTNTKEV